MNGATALLCAKTSSRPRRTRTTAIGAIQYFFSWRRKLMNSPRTDCLAIQIQSLFCRVQKDPPYTSIQMLVVLRIAQPLRRGRPRRLRRAPPLPQPVAPDQALQDAVRGDDDEKQQRQQNAAVDPAESARETHPHA